MSKIKKLASGAGRMLTTWQSIGKQIDTSLGAKLWKSPASHVEVGSSIERNAHPVLVLRKLPTTLFSGYAILYVEDTHNCNNSMVG